MSSGGVNKAKLSAVQKSCADIPMETPNAIGASHSKVGASTQEFTRVRLKVVVEDCAKRWFEEYLIAAQQGDTDMQLLVGQMFISGYGVHRDPVKGRYWLEKAHRERRPNQHT